MGLSLWVVPSPNEFERLQPVLDDLAKYGKGPAFQPHVTLVSVPISTPLPFPPLGFDKAPPMTLRFLKVQTGESYFQSVLIAIDPTPELVNLHDSVRQTLNYPLPPGASYFPHLSLFYGGDQELKESLVQRLHEQGTVVSREGEYGDTVAGISEIHIEEIWLVRSEGPPEVWEVVEKWRLGTSVSD
ncbi:RNA ligase/cyclic nucleotide phosphodiesterase [Rhizoctonia solani]|nr:RNA ligase/cyclic nucleotide phosphodiesterase [Rhizoctonia solani]